MIQTNYITALASTLALAALIGAAPSFAQASAVSAESSSATQNAIEKEKSGTDGAFSPQPASGVRSPGVVTNSLDATGTFSSGPLTNTAPGFAIDPNTGLSGSANLNAGSYPSLATPPSTVNMLPPSGTSGATLPAPEPVKP